MPKLYAVLGIVLRFYSDEHRPIHVHAQRDGLESVVEIFFKDGRVSSVRVRRGSPRPLSEKDLRIVRSFVEAHAAEITDAWTGYFVKGIKPAFKTVRSWKP